MLGRPQVGFRSVAVVTLSYRTLVMSDDSRYRASTNHGIKSIAVHNRVEKHRGFVFSVTRISQQSRFCAGTLCHEVAERCRLAESRTAAAQQPPFVHVAS